jgi:hypothetical protein
MENDPGRFEDPDYDGEEENDGDDTNFSIGRYSAADADGP